MPPRRCRISNACLGFLALSLLSHAQPARAQSRPTIGVALGGGSAKGIAHIGVLRWFEEHHIPVDVVAGTSMGGLIGGAFATGMSPAELEALIAGTDWTAMFGDANFTYMNVRRKRDARAYPSHLEYGLKKGFLPPPAINNGQQVEFMLARIAAPYYGVATFDDLPTPFRCVAVDLKSATPVVLDRGPLATAMRATMSLPLVFPPVAIDNYLLVDGGALNNVPADVTRAMGASRVVAVNVSDMSGDTPISPSLMGLVSSTLDAMMRANTVRTLAAADVVINVPLKDYGSLDWRRHTDLIKAGYDAAEALKMELLPLAVDDTAWKQWVDKRAAARRTTLPPPSFVRVEGATPADEARITRALALRLNQPVEMAALEADLTHLGGLERYETLTWRLISEGGRDGVLITARPKTYGPPFLFLAISLENTTSDTFNFGLAGRYLSFDSVGAGSELRIDASVGSSPSAAVSLYKPIGHSALFVDGGALVSSRTLNAIEDDQVVATYHRVELGAIAAAGVNLGRLSDVRAGVSVGRISATRRIGDPGLPELDGQQTVMHVRWTHDGQDSPITPTRGLHTKARLDYYIDAPSPPDETVTTRETKHVTQFDVEASQFWSRGPARRQRFMLSGGMGTSFDGRPLPTEQFELGGALRLSAFSSGEARGDHYGLLTAGYLHQIARLPDLFGGAVLLGGWLETGSAFDHWRDADVAVQATTGIVADTLIGPMFAGFSVDLQGGGTRYYVGIGRLLR